MKVAVVRNRDNHGVISRFGQPCPEVYGSRSVQNVIDGLRAGGHTVAFFEGDKRLIANLEQFLPPEGESGRPGGMVFNMSYGIQGDCRYAHVPAMLEMAGVPYTGSTPLGHALALDKVVTKILMREAGAPTPAYRVLSRAGEEAEGLRFPLIVKPRHESTSYGLHFVRDGRELASAVREVVEEYQQDALVEEYIEGREVCVGLLGNDPVELLPLVELDFSGRELRAMTWADKHHKTANEPRRICPAAVSEELAGRLRAAALATFRACRCRDYARVDIRIDPSGEPFVLEINSMASLGAGGAFVLAAKTAGYTFEALVCRIVDVAHQRYFGTAAARGGGAAVEEGAGGWGAGAQESAAAGEAGAIGGVEYAPCPGVFSPQQLRGDDIPPYKATRFYEEQIRRSGHYERLRHVVEPSLAEVGGPGAWDTSGEGEHTVVRGLQHKFGPTALVLATDQCFSHCRFCFRKRLVSQTSEEVACDYGLIAEYIREHAEITDVLLSGGDPLVLSTEQLHRIMDHLLPIGQLTSIRLGTKALTYYPPRFQDTGLADLFRRIALAGKTPAVVAHVDHFGEIGEETERAVRKLLALGVQLFNQMVLLREVNDDADILAATLGKLHSLGVRPYYLFQARPVKGAGHFQVPLRRGIEIVREANGRLSGLQKTYRYVMSHYTGKIEILEVGEDQRLYLRYHQHRDPRKIGLVFSRPYREGACWLDDLAGSSEAPCAAGSVLDGGA